MKITKQTNHNECGICVINSLVEYFYHRSNKIQILNKAKLSSDGLTIYDFETLSNEFGLNAETYQLSWEEFIEYKSSSYMVTLINEGNNLHYIIFKKHRSYIDVYDSNKGIKSQNVCFFRG